MKALPITILLVAIASAALSQRANINRDSLTRSVVDLQKDTTIIDTNGKPKKMTISGTGLLLIKNDKEFYIVTAAHVAKSMDLTAYIILSGSGDIPQKLKLLDLISEAKPHWSYHKRADLAVLKLNPSHRIMSSGILNHKFISVDYMNSDSTKAVSRDLQLTVIGFPLALGTERRFSPLTYRTYASSGFLTMGRADTHLPCEFIMLENPSVGGYSGGPVFDTSITVINSITTYGEGTMCYGFIHGTISDETGGKLAAVTPSYFLFDLIK